MSKTLHLMLLALLGFSGTAFSQVQNYTVAGLERGVPVFKADTLVLKQYFTQLIDTALVKKTGATDTVFDKVSIEDAYLTDYNTKYYYLLFRNFELKLKLAITLVADRGSLVLLADKPLVKGMDINMRYLYCYGTDDDCFPNLYVDEKGKVFWTSTVSELAFCSPDDPRKQVSGMLGF